jgi:hypothetical protein
MVGMQFPGTVRAEPQAWVSPTQQTGPVLQLDHQPVVAQSGISFPAAEHAASRIPLPRASASVRVRATTIAVTRMLPGDGLSIPVTLRRAASPAIRAVKARTGASPSSRLPWSLNPNSTDHCPDADASSATSLADHQPAAGGPAGGHGGKSPSCLSPAEKYVSSVCPKRMKIRSARSRPQAMAASAPLISVWSKSSSSCQLAQNRLSLGSAIRLAGTGSVGQIQTVPRRGIGRFSRPRCTPRVLPVDRSHGAVRVPRRFRGNAQRAGCAFPRKRATVERPLKRPRGGA